MTQWTSEQLDKVGKAEEVQIASFRPDGTPRKPVTVWVVRHGDDLYIRSVTGPGGGWFRGAQEKHEGRIRAGGVQQDVTFVEADHDINDEVLDSVLTPEARSATLRLVPRSSSSWSLR